MGAEQAMVVGEGRPYLVAIVCYDGGMTAEQKATFEKNLDKMNAGLADYERVRRCLVLDRLFSLERGELTRTLKLRRENIESSNEREVSLLYGVAVTQAMVEIGPGENV